MLASSFGVRGYPTLIWFVDGEPVPFEGAHTKDDIVDWVLLRGGPLVATLANSTALEVFRLSYAVTAVITAEPQHIDPFERVCRQISAVPIRCARLVAAPPPDGPAASLVVYRAIDDASVFYEGPLPLLRWAAPPIAEMGRSPC